MLFSLTKHPHNELSGNRVVATSIDADSINHDAQEITLKTGYDRNNTMHAGIVTLTMSFDEAKQLRDLIEWHLSELG